MEEPNYERFKEKISAGDICYPYAAPECFNGIIFDFGEVYKCLPGATASSGSNNRLIEDDFRSQAASQA